jgi:hypothetical protein
MGRRDFPRCDGNSIGGGEPAGRTLRPLVPPCLDKELDRSCELNSKALFAEDHPPPPLDSANNEGPWIARLGNFKIPRSKYSVDSTGAKLVGRVVRR